jgi:hypothetical protein
MNPALPLKFIQQDDKVSQQFVILLQNPPTIDDKAPLVVLDTPFIVEEKYPLVVLNNPLPVKA